MSMCGSFPVKVAAKAKHKQGLGSRLKVRVKSKPGSWQQGGTGADERDALGGTFGVVGNTWLGYFLFDIPNFNIRFGD